MAVQLGQKYKDTITGWEGVAEGVHHWMNGCMRVTLLGTKDGEPKSFTIDVQTLVDEDGNPADVPAIEAAALQTALANRALAGYSEQPAEEPKTKRKRGRRVGGPRSTPGRTGA